MPRGILNKNSAKIGGTAIHERLQDRKLEILKKAVEKWATEQDIWHEASFLIPYEHEDNIPEKCDVLALVDEGTLGRVFIPDHEEIDELRQQLDRLLEKHGFQCEAINHYKLGIYPIDEAEQDAYHALYRWRWIQKLANERLFGIHAEVYEHFRTHPEDLKRLSWRQYEELLDAIFRNQGYRTKLGPGTNDGGVDIRLYQSQAIPELVTLVQARRYTSRPIGLEAVAALFGHVIQQGANRGVFATTSCFQPKARRFADTVSQNIAFPPIELVDLTRVSGWCADLSKCLNDFYGATALSEPPIIAHQGPSGLVGKVVVTSFGYDMTMNQFCVIENDFAHEVILRTIGNKKLGESDQVGEEVPSFESDGPAERFVAFKVAGWKPGEIAFKGNHKIFHLWDGTPQRFNFLD